MDWLIGLKNYTQSTSIHGYINTQISIHFLVKFPYETFKINEKTVENRISECLQLTNLYNLFRTQQQQENGIHQNTWWRVEHKCWQEMAHEIQLHLQHLHLQHSVRSCHQQDPMDVVDVTTDDWQKGQVFFKIPYPAEKRSTLIYNGDFDNFQGSFPQGRGPSQPKWLPDSQEQNLQVRYPTLSFQANETPFWHKFGVRDLEESAVCHIQKEDDCQRRSTGRHIPDIFRPNPNPRHNRIFGNYM